MNKNSMRPIIFDVLIELSNFKLMSKIQHVVTRQKITIRNEERTTYSRYKDKLKTVMVQKYSVKATSPKKRKKGRYRNEKGKMHVCTVVW